MAVIDGRAGRRRHNRIASQLDPLQNQHGQRRLGARRPREVVREVIVNLDPVSPGRWKLDGARGHAQLRGQNEAPFDANLVAYGTNGSLVAEYRAICDDAPDGDFEFEAAAPPAWLRRM